jgi:hypothetical protein
MNVISLPPKLFASSFPRSQEFCSLLYLLASVLALGECGSDGRFQAITNTHTNCGDKPDATCGIGVLDTRSGTVFVRDNAFWREEHPQDGAVTAHTQKLVVEAH